MRISYNAPFVLTFTFFCIGIMLYSGFSNPLGGEEAAPSELMQKYFTVYPGMSFLDPMTYVRLISHSAGHANWVHLFSNLTFILLLGPILEEKYGSKRLILMTLMTALVTGLLNNFLLNTPLLGASGIVFMMIILSSFSNYRSGSIPLTFILVVVIFLGQEILNALRNDNISQFAHIVGGICGSIFGFSGIDENGA